jgi:dihydrofolate reductase
MGVDGKLPWQNIKNEITKRDMAWFKECTWGDTVIMGRKTWESMGSKPLKNRFNRIVSSTLIYSQLYKEVNPTAHTSLSSAIKCSTEQWGVSDFGLEKDDPTIWIIGGASLYKEGMDICDRIFMTMIPDIEFVAGSDYECKNVEFIDGENKVYFPQIPDSFVHDYRVTLVERSPVPLVVEVYKRKVTSRSKQE